MVSLKWDSFPIRYFVSNRDVPGVSAQQFRDAVGRAFATWEAVPNTAMSSQFAGFTQASPLDDDNMSVIGFANRPDLDRVLGSTSFTLDVVTGQIVESDIFLNSGFAWSVASGGDPGAYDVESIALHEIGHLHGLGHSALGETQLMGGNRLVLAAEAVMFPVAFSAGSVNERTLRADDIAGLSDLYGNDTFRHTAGSISGRVTKNGEGIFGAHVIAFSPSTGKLVGGFTLDDTRQLRDRGARSRSSGDSCRAARRCGYRQLLRLDIRRRRRFQACLLHASGRRARRGHRQQRRGEGGAEVRRLSIALSLGFIAALASPAMAQVVHRDVPHAGSVEIAGAVVLSGGYDAGTSQALETSNPQVKSTPLTLFQGDGQLRPAAGIEARLGVYLAPRWSVEGGVQVTKPTLRLSLSNDFEMAPDTVAEEQLTQYVIDGTLLYHFATFSNGHAGLFLAGGGGYLRQLDDGNENVTTGSQIHGGGGFHYWFGSGGQRLGLRLEGRLAVRNGSVDLEMSDTRRLVPTFSAGLAYLF